MTPPCEGCGVGTDRDPCPSCGFDHALEEEFRSLGSHWLLNGPRRSWRWPIWLLDELLDRIPTRSDGRWYRTGGWGCRWRMWRWWWRDERDNWDAKRPPMRDPFVTGWVIGVLGLLVTLIAAWVWHEVQR